MVTEQKIKLYQKRLEEEKNRLLGEMSKEEQPEHFISEGDVVTPEEEADAAEEYGNNLAVEQTHRENINEIDNALNKIKSGEYGLCENCGREISEKILDLIPESALCEDCKRKA